MPTQTIHSGKGKEGLIKENLRLDLDADKFRNIYIWTPSFYIEITSYYAIFNRKGKGNIADVV